MKNIVLRNKIDKINLNKIFKENNKEKEEEDDNEIDGNDEDIRIWIKVKDKLSGGVFPCDILKEFPFFMKIIIIK
jgi:hypothetical protein